jgi:ubiquinol-cytochrome c reductase cytochrome b subunit
MTNPTGRQNSIGTLLATSAAGLYVQYLLQFAVGIALQARFHPSIDAAHSSIRKLREEATGRLLADFHYWGSAVLVATATIHVVLMLWFGWYRHPHRGRWFASLAMLAGAMGFQLTGNLLPMDRHDVQTAVVEAAIAARVPGIGPELRRAVLGGDGFGQSTLDLWWWVHRFALTGLVLVAMAGAFVVHLRRKDVRENRVAMLLPVLVALGLALSFSAPFGEPATPADYNRFDAKVGWYVWPMHGALRMFESFHPSLGWIGAAVLPGLFGVFLVALAIVQPKEGVARAGLCGFLAVFGFGAVRFGGLPASATGVQALPSPAAPVESSFTPVDAALSKRGRTLFAVEGCADCHGKDGRNGAAGPDLGEVHRRHPEAEWYVRFLANPQAVKPNSTMPAFAGIGETKLRALAEWLRDPDRETR